MKTISHIGIAVNDLETSKKTFGALLRVAAFHEETVPDQKVRVASCEVGDTRLELTQATDPDSAIAKFIAKRGEGIHHIAFEVGDVDAEMARLKEEGFVFVGERPSDGAHNMRIVFLHPKSTNGVLVELCQNK